jgi:hypothetical protein
MLSDEFPLFFDLLKTQQLCKFQPGYPSLHISRALGHPEAFLRMNTTIISATHERTSTKERIEHRVSPVRVVFGIALAVHLSGV